MYRLPLDSVARPRGFGRCRFLLPWRIAPAAHLARNDSIRFPPTPLSEIPTIPRNL